MPELLGRDAGYQAVEGAQLGLAAEIEALEHVVAERRHLTVLATQQLLQGRCSIRVLLLGLRKLHLQLVDAHEHQKTLSSM